MHQEISGSHQPPGNIIHTEQAEEIIKAVLAGKYSWACVLFLYFLGYNPIKYLPYRTYIRLLKNNYLIDQKHGNMTNQNQMEMLDVKTSWMSLGKSTNGSN